MTTISPDEDAPECAEPKTDRELLLAVYREVRGLVRIKEDHEVRIRVLERSFWKVIGISSALSFTAGFLGGVVGFLLEVW